MKNIIPNIAEIPMIGENPNTGLSPEMEKMQIDEDKPAAIPELNPIEMNEVDAGQNNSGQKEEMSM